MDATVVKTLPQANLRKCIEDVAVAWLRKQFGVAFLKMAFEADRGVAVGGLVSRMGLSPLHGYGSCSRSSF